MKNYFTLAFLLIFCGGLMGQGLMGQGAVAPGSVGSGSIAPGMVDSLKKGKLTIEAYVDVYYSYAASHPVGGTRPYFVSYNRDNEINLDLAYVSLKYVSDRVRGSFSPGYGTYMNANYAAERQTLQNIIEASVGVRIFKKKDIWLDGGVFVAPYTNESVYSIDQLTYTRSLGADLTPYYLTGAKLTVPLGSRWTAYLYLLNGWQVIESQHDPLDFGSQLEYKPNDKWDFNWNTYLGNESSIQNPGYRRRMFGDLSAAYNPSAKWSFAADMYSGWQQRYEDSGLLRTRQWWSVIFSARYTFLPGNSLSLRVEHFDDSYAVLVKPVINAPGVKLSSASLGYNYSVTEDAMIRVEGRYFRSPYGLYPLRNQTDADNDTWLTVGLTARFR